MIKAIHKRTGKLVSAYRIATDILWKGTASEEWIAPTPEIGNWPELREKNITEVPVSYIKSHTREIGDRKIWVVSHFRINCDHAKENPLNESEEHKIAKNGIYDLLVNDQIMVGGRKISEFAEIEDIDIEHRLSPSKTSKIADVIVKFKREHQLYGRGIVFEIQFSNQSEEIILERTYDRVLEGYSVCWLFHGHFDSKQKLKLNDLKITPFMKAKVDYQETKAQEIKNTMHKQIEYMDKYYEDMQSKVINLDFTWNEKLKGQHDFFLKERVEFKDNLTIYKKMAIEEMLEKGNQVKREVNEHAEKIKSEIVNNPNLISEVSGRIDTKEVSEEVKSKILSDIEPKILNETKEVAALALVNHVASINTSQLQDNIFKVVRDDIKAKMEGSVEEFEPYACFNCSVCKNRRRIETGRIFQGKVMCYECKQIREVEVEKPYYIREVLNGEKQLHKDKAT